MAATSGGAQQQNDRDGRKTGQGWEGTSEETGWVRETATGSQRKRRAEGRPGKMVQFAAVKIYEIDNLLQKYEGKISLKLLYKLTLRLVLITISCA